MAAIGIIRQRLAVPNAVWAALESMLHPLLLLAATPVFAASLQASGFGLWSLFLAVIAMGGAASAGTVTAAATMIALQVGQHRPAAITGVVREALTIAEAGFGRVVLVLGLLGIPLAAALLGRLGAPATIAWVCTIALLVAWVEHVDQVYSAVWKGLEAFSLAARVEVAIRCGQFLVLIAVAVAGLGIASLIGAYLLSSVVRLLVKRHLVLQRLPELAARPASKTGADAATGRPGEVRRRALWGWVQGAGGLAFGSVDRILIGALLGPVAIAQYTVGMQIASQFHAVVAAALSVLAPEISRLSAAAQNRSLMLRRIGLCAVLNTVVCLTGYAALAAIGPSLVSAWLGWAPDDELAFMGPLLLAYLLLSLNIVPFHVLSGLGWARPIGLVCALGGILTALAAWWWVPADGLEGAAAARVLYAVVTLMLLPLLMVAIRGAPAARRCGGPAANGGEPVRRQGGLAASGEAAPRCPDCGASDPRRIGRLPDPRQFAGCRLDAPLAGGSLYACAACALKFRYPVLDPQAYAALYDNETEASWTTSLRTDQRLAVDYLAGSLRAGSVLDFGCYTGQFLASLPAGFERHGVEVNARAAVKARHEAAATVWSSLAGIEQDRCFDAVVCMDVIEHFQSPLALMTELLERVRPGGVLLITTGDADAALWRRFGARWWYCSYAEHVAFISRAWIGHHADRLGVTVERCEAFNYKRESVVLRAARWAALAGAVVAAPFTGWIAGWWRGGRAEDVPVKSVPGVGLSADHLFIVLRKH